MRSLIVVASLLCAFCAVAAKAKGPGLVEKPGSMKGKILFVNSQTAVDQAAIAEVAENWQKFLKIDISVAKGEKVDIKGATAAAEKTGANLVLFIVDDDALGTSIVYAPETKWCILNVRPIFADKPDAKTIAMRAKQETTRAFSLLAGAMNSAYPNSLMTAVKSPRELDLNEEPWRVPIDVIERLKPWCAAHGIMPRVFAPYRKACQEGWAPAPTNDAQKAVWDKVHQIPTKPIKIEFDPKTDKK